MEENSESKLVMYSLGIVMEDKLRGSDQIKIYPVEEFPQINGKISDFKPAYNVSTSNIKGATKSSDLKGDAVLVATWLPFGNSNRITSPDVIKNETVSIYRYADTNEYYWDTLFREPSLRRLETCCTMFGDLKDGVKEYNKESSYWFEVSTHDQHIKVHTSRSNQEPFMYDIILDTKNGNLTIKDDIGNIIYLDSQAHQIKLTNTEGAYYDMMRENITVNAPKTIRNVCQDFIVEASGSVTTKAGSAINETAGSSTSRQAPNHSIVGNTAAQGTISSSGNMSTAGSISVTGDVSTQSNVNAGANVTVGGNVQAVGTVHGSNI